MRWFSKPAFSAMALRGYALAPALGISSVWRRSTAAPALQLVSGRGGSRGRGSTVTWRDAEGRSQRKIHARPGLVAAPAIFKPHLWLLFMLRSKQVSRRSLYVRRRAASVSRWVLHIPGENGTYVIRSAHWLSVAQKINADFRPTVSHGSLNSDKSSFTFFETLLRW